MFLWRRSGPPSQSVVLAEQPPLRKFNLDFTATIDADLKQFDGMADLGESDWISYEMRFLIFRSIGRAGPSVVSLPCTSRNASSSLKRTE